MKPITLYPHEIRRLLDHGSALLVRPVKPQPPWTIDDVYCEDGIWRFDSHADGHWYDTWPNDNGLRCPYGPPGSMAWGRETWGVLEMSYDFEYGWECGGLVNDRITQTSLYHPVTYPDRYDRDSGAEEGSWRSPVTMPAWASRLSVEVSDVRCVRVGELSEADMLTALNAPDWQDDGPEPYKRQADRAFAMEWKQRYGKQYPWPDAWVWTVELKMKKEENDGRRIGTQTRTGSNKESI